MLDLAGTVYASRKKKLRVTHASFGATSCCIDARHLCRSFSAFASRTSAVRFTPHTASFVYRGVRIGGYHSPGCARDIGSFCIACCTLLFFRSPPRHATALLARLRRAPLICRHIAWHLASAARSATLSLCASCFSSAAPCLFAAYVREKAYFSI